MYHLICDVIVGLVLAGSALAFWLAKRKGTLSAYWVQHLAFAGICGFMGLLLPLVIILPDMFHGDPSMSAPEAVYAYAHASGQFSEAQLSVISAGVRKAHADYWGSPGPEAVFLIYPLVFLGLGVAHLAIAFTTGRKGPNKSPPTGTEREPPAAAESAARRS